MFPKTKLTERIKTIRKNILSLALGEIISKILGFLLCIVLARHLGPKHYGMYSLALSYSVIFMVLSNFGLNTLLIKDVSRNHVIASQYLGTNLLLKIFFSTISIILLLLSLLILKYNSLTTYAILIFSISIIFSSMAETISSYFKSIEKMEYASMSIILTSILIFVLSIFSIYLIDAGILTLISIRTLAIAVIFILIYYILITKFIKPDYHIKSEMYLSTIKNGLPFLTTGIIFMLFFKTDILMLSKLATEKHIGWYTASSDLIITLFIIPSLISTAILPMLSKKYKENPKSLNTVINFSVKLLLCISIPISFGLFFFASKIINFIYGVDYGNSVQTLQILGLGTCITFPREMYSTALIACDKITSMMWINLSALILNIILNSLLIPKYANNGAAIASIISILFIQLISYFILIKKFNDLVLFSYYLKPIFVSLITVIILKYILPLNLIAQSLTGILIFCMIILMIGYFNKTELSIIKSFMSFEKKVDYDEYITPK